MAVITISRQLGSRGAKIARDLSAELGYRFVDKSVINKVIREYGLTQLNAIYDHKPKVWELFNDNSIMTIDMMNRTIQAFAARGDVVILGRGGFKVLQGLGDVLNVFVKAPQDVRVKRIAKRGEIELTADQAAEVISADDAMRARFTKLFYSTDWADEDQFDLVVDTGELSLDEAKDRIRIAHNALPRNAEPTIVGAEIDPVLGRTIDEVLAKMDAKSAK